MYQRGMIRPANAKADTLPEKASLLPLFDLYNSLLAKADVSAKSLHESSPESPAGFSVFINEEWRIPVETPPIAELEPYNPVTISPIPNME